MMCDPGFYVQIVWFGKRSFVTIILHKDLNLEIYKDQGSSTVTRQRLCL